MAQFIDGTMLNHGWLNSNGTKRGDHCCGCWNVYAAEDGDVNKPFYFAVCNECGEERDMSSSAHLDGLA